MSIKMKLFHKVIQVEKPEGTFVEDRLRTRNTRKNTTLFLLSGVAFIGWIYVFFFSNTFTVQRLEIEGAKELKRGDIEEAADAVFQKMHVWPFREKNIFFIDEKIFTRELTDKLFTQSITVDKKYPNILRLKIKERQSSLVILKEGRFWQIDRNGVIMREIADGQEKVDIQDQINHPVSDRSQVLPILEISHDADPSIGNTYVSDFRVSLWLDTFKSLQELGFGYRHAMIDYATSTKLILKMFEPYDVYMNMSLTEPIEPQVYSLYEFMRIKKDVDIKEYIDARIPGKIYYQ